MRSAFTSRMRALVCEVSVTMPACEPVSEIASWPEVVDHHRRQRARDPLAGGQQHVHLARVRALGDLVGHRHQLVGGLPARGQHRHHAVALLGRLHDPPGGALDPLGVGHRGAAELHHDGLGVCGAASGMAEAG